MSEELTVWTPSPFEGTDLLPVGLGQKKMDMIGRDNIEAEDLILPSLSCLQGMSDPVTNGVEGARPGLFWLSGAEEVLEGPLRVLLCAHTKSRALFPKDDRPEHVGLVECTSRDGVEGSHYGLCDSCPHQRWDDAKKLPPACSESHNFTALTPLGPAIIRFSRTSIKSARKLLTAWSMSSDPLFAHPAVITAKQQQRVLSNGRSATYYSMDIRWLQRETVPPHVQSAARALYEQVMAAHEHGKFGADSAADDAE